MTLVLHTIIIPTVCISVTSRIMFSICCFIYSAYQAYKHYLQFKSITFYLNFLHIAYLAHVSPSSKTPRLSPTPTFMLTISKIKKMIKNEYQNKQAKPIKQHKKVKMEIKSPKIKWSSFWVGQLLLGM